MTEGQIWTGMPTLWTYRLIFICCVVLHPSPPLPLSLSQRHPRIVSKGRENGGAVGEQAHRGNHPTPCHRHKLITHDKKANILDGGGANMSAIKPLAEFALGSIAYVFSHVLKNDSPFLWASAGRGGGLGGLLFSLVFLFLLH